MERFCSRIWYLFTLLNLLFFYFIWLLYFIHSEHVEMIASTNRNVVLADSGYTSGENSATPDEENDQILFNVMQVFKAVVIQLPNANRDSLAFLFIHLNHLVNMKSVTKLNAEILVKVFAPLIVGNSRQQFRASISNNSQKEDLTVGVAEISETEKQETVMRSLFRLSIEFWNRLLKDPKFCPIEGNF